uniref:GIY-YIG domain-containing protein n=1 Tax=Pyxicephalus adspersus TaxID=30357 RepID=A0AAV3AS04_PYXAD|nr:TPA: hypothetical protein GDO54_009528 [Pyxicephalus adspersus]
MQEKAKQSLMTRFKILTKNVPDSQNEEELRNVLRSITFPEEIEVCDQVKEFAGKTELYIGNGKDMAADRLALQKILKGFTVLADSDEEEETSSRNVKYKIAALKSLVVYVPSTLLYGGTEILEMPGTNDSDPLAMNFIQDALDDVEVLLLLSEYGFRLTGREVRDCLKNSSFIKQWIKDPHNYKLMFRSYPEKNLIYQFGAKDGEKIEKIMQEEDKKKEEEFQKFKDLLQPGDPRDILEKNNAFLKNTGIELLIKEIDQITLQRKKDIISELKEILERSSLNAEKKWSEIESRVTDTTAFNPQYGGRHPVFKLFIYIFFIPFTRFLGKTRTSFNENTLKKNFEGLFKDNMKKYVLEPVFRGGIKNTKCKVSMFTCMFVFYCRWPSNLAKYMVRICIPLKYSSKPGSTFCGDLKCSVCPYIESTTTFTGKNKNKVYKISGILNCTTKNVIYLITCKKCEQQYVGQTTRMVKKRFTVHLSGIRSQKESKNESFLANHFKSEGHSEHDIALVVIQQVSNARSLMEREKYWIRELDTLIPEGLNATL